MRRPLYIWLIFAVCVVAASAAVVWASAIALRLDRSEADARRQAAFEENVRLALWRMDSAIAPVIARENSRPYFDYSAFYPAGAVYTRMFAPVSPGTVLLPSPILADMPQYVLLHFQYGPDGTLSSPQVPTGNMLDIAETKMLTEARIEKSAELLKEMGGLCDRATLAGLIPATPPAAAPAAPIFASGGRGSLANVSQQALNSGEFQAREQRFSNSQRAAVENQGGQLRQAPAQRVNEGVMKPVWIGNRLLLVRRVNVGSAEYVQGCLLDWPALVKDLLDGVADIFPHARLASLPGGVSGGNTGRMLAAIPAELIPGSAESVAGEDMLSPLKIALIVVWGALLLAAGAIGALLWGAIALGERRGAFVSAVTHELRTPLTTFRIYTEMLSEGMVDDEAVRREYLATLRLEAERLSHLVENVLAYSRLERNRAGGPIEIMTIQALVERAMPRLAARAREAGMEIAADETSMASLAVLVDASAVEQILFNLVDNAAKYASSAADKRISIRAAQEGRFAAITVSDSGPGISRCDARKLFRPFSRSASEAANSAPGVGLGLALCRRIARRLGGNLRLDKGAAGGAAFTLLLPLAAR